MGFLSRGGTRWLPAAAAALAAFALLSCLQRDYENPFLIGDSGLEESWRQDRDGNGISDSVEYHAPGCRVTPAECLRIALDASIAKAQAGAPKGPVDSVPPRVQSPDPPKDTADVAPPKDTAVVKPPKDTAVVVPPKDTAVVKPPKDTAVVVPPKDTSIVKPPEDTTVAVPPRDTLVVPPPKDTVIVVLPPDTVRIPIVPVIAVTGIQAAEVYLPLGASKVTPAVHVLPRDARQQGYTLSSLDESIVRVSGADLVPVNPGMARIVARSLEGGFTAEFAATVLVPDTQVHEEAVTVAPMEMSVGDPPRAPAIAWMPAKTSNQSYSLTSGNPAVVRVVTEGGTDRCGPAAPGMATVTLKTQGKGLVATFQVTVRPAAVRVDSVFSPDLTLILGETAVPVIAFLPPDAADQGYALASNKPETAAVNGREIIAVRNGAAEITVTSRDGGKSHVFKVLVKKDKDEE